MIPQVLLFNIKGEKLKKIKMLSAVLKIKAVEISPDDFAQTLGALSGLEEKTGIRQESAFSEEMLVMVHFSRAHMNAFLGGFKRNKIPTIALKAMLTPTNTGWSANRLFEEISAEQKAMQKGEKLHK